MGSLQRRFARGGGPRPRSNGSQNGPLRKIEGRILNAQGAPRDLLECGHEVLPARDLMGERFPVRRRCKECKRTDAHALDEARECEDRPHIMQCTQCGQGFRCETKPDSAACSNCGAPVVWKPVAPVSPAAQEGERPPIPTWVSAVFNGENVSARMASEAAFEIERWRQYANTLERANAALTAERDRAELERQAAVAQRKKVEALADESAADLEDEQRDHADTRAQLASARREAEALKADPAARNARDWKGEAERVQRVLDVSTSRIKALESDLASARTEAIEERKARSGMVSEEVALAAIKDAQYEAKHGPCSAPEYHLSEAASSPVAAPVPFARRMTPSDAARFWRQLERAGFADPLCIPFDELHESSQARTIAEARRVAPLLGIEIVGGEEKNDASR